MTAQWLPVTYPVGHLKIFSAAGAVVGITLEDFVGTNTLVGTDQLEPRSTTRGPASRVDRFLAQGSWTGRKDTMRNVVCVRESRVELEKLGFQQQAPCSAVWALHSSGQRLFVVPARDGALQLTVVELLTGKCTVLLGLVAAALATSASVVVGLEHQQEADAVVVLLRSGDLLSVPCYGAAGRPECVGCVDSGAVGMGWSPDGELVVIATGNSTLFCMTKQWIQVAEVPIRRVGDSAPTTFQVSWEGDGSRFVTNTTFADGSSTVSLWSRECALLATCEAVDGGCGGPVAFRPSGFLVAASSVGSLVLFEANGLRRGGFDLRRAGTTEHAAALCWNPDASLLVTLCDGFLELWRSSNHCWHLCWEEFVGRDAAFVGWSQAHAARLVVACATQRALRVLDFIRDVSCSAQNAQLPNDECLAAVVDGHAVRLTPLKTKAVPPPMSDSEARLPFVACSLSTRLPGPRTAALSAEGRLYVFGPGSVSYRDTVLASGAGFHQVAWFSETVVLALSWQALYAFDTVQGKTRLCCGCILCLVSYLMPRF
jgi:hypothetical protein